MSARFAKQQGIQGRMCDVIVNDGSTQARTRVTEVHELPVKVGPNEIVNRQSFEIPDIGTGGPVEDLPTNLKSVFFPGCESREWATWDGHSIDIVIGMDNADLFPMPLAGRDSLILSKSVLTNLLIVWGREERVQRLDLGPLEVNELMPEAHMFNQSIVDHSICIQEVPEIVVPDIVVPSAPELEPEPEQPTSQVEEQGRRRSSFLLPRYSSNLSPGSFLRSSFLSSCIFAPWGAMWRLSPLFSGLQLIGIAPPHSPRFSEVT